VDGVLARFGDWGLKEVDFLNTVQLITAKPVVYLVNLPEKAYIKKKSKWLPKVRAKMPPCALAACDAGHTASAINMMGDVSIDGGRQMFRSPRHQGRP
jgi:predicted nucleic acid binding AN1-type Zn finger protein